MKRTWVGAMTFVFPKKYNKLFKIEKKIKHEKLKRKDHKYDLLIPIKYNFNKPIAGDGSCIFIHLNQRLQSYSWMYCFKRKRFFDYD